MPTLFSRSFTLFSIAMCASLGIASGAHAAVIFAEDFNRPNSDTVGVLWQEWEQDSNDVALYNQQLRLRDHQSEQLDAAVWRQVDTSGYENLQLAFDWRASNSTEASDTLHAGWRDSQGSMHAFWSQSLGGSGFTNQTIALDGFALNTLFDLSFWIDVSAATETVYLDNLLLSGDTIAGTRQPPSTDTGAAVSVYEPGSIALLVMGLSALAWRRKSLA